MGRERRRARRYLSLDPAYPKNRELVPAVELPERDLRFTSRGR
jgi:hypothetical protein